MFYHTLALSVEIMRCFWKTCSSLFSVYFNTQLGFVPRDRGTGHQTCNTIKVV